MLSFAFSATSALCAPASSSKSTACAAPEYRQFDFWLGDWNAFDIAAGDKVSPSVSAHILVEGILDGCVLHEHYADPQGLKGNSFTIYDRSRKLWHQTWVTNKGQLLVIEGTAQGKKEIVLSGKYEDWAGKKITVRGVWKAVPGGVRETAVKSTDGGKSWEPWFDLMFKPRVKK